MEVRWHPDARIEFEGIREASERVAIEHAIEKLEAMGVRLRYPHQSQVWGVEAGDLRELRPRRGKSPYRAFYRRIGELMVIGAIGPEGEIDKRGFDHAVLCALERLHALEGR